MAKFEDWCIKVTLKDLHLTQEESNLHKDINVKTKRASKEKTLTNKKAKTDKSNMKSLVK